MYPIFIPMSSSNVNIPDKILLVIYISLNIIMIINYIILFLIWFFKNRYEDFSFVENVLGYNKGYSLFAPINSLLFIIINGIALFCILFIFIFNLIK